MLQLNCLNNSAAGVGGDKIWTAPNIFSSISTIQEVFMTRSQILVSFHCHFLWKKSTSHTFSQKCFNLRYYGQFGYVDSEKYHFGIRKLMQNTQILTFFGQIGQKMPNFGPLPGENSCKAFFSSTDFQTRHIGLFCNTSNHCTWGIQFKNTTKSTK